MRVYQATADVDPQLSESVTGAATPVSESDVTESLAPELLARANAYSVLGALLVNPPTNALLKSIVPSPSSLEGVGGDTAEGWRALAAVAFAKDAHTPVYSDTQLNDEYHAMFIGVVRGEVMPYGSWYMSGFLMDKPLAALRADLEALGFERAKGVAEPEDHAGALCETMAMIIQSPDVSERAERTFFDRHMRPWMNLFFKDMAGAKTAEFYCGVGEFGQRFISFEKDYFDIAGR